MWWCRTIWWWRRLVELLCMWLWFSYLCQLCHTEVLKSPSSICLLLSPTLFKLSHLHFQMEKKNRRTVRSKCKCYTFFKGINLYILKKKKHHLAYGNNTAKTTVSSNIAPKHFLLSSSTTSHIWITITRTCLMPELCHITTYLLYIVGCACVSFGTSWPNFVGTRDLVCQAMDTYSDLKSRE